MEAEVENHDRVSLPSSAGLPAFADDEVPCAGEGHRISTAGRREVDTAASLVVLVVVLAAGEVMGTNQEVGCVRTGRRCRKHGGDCGDGERQVVESDHHGACMRFWMPFNSRGNDGIDEITPVSCPGLGGYLSIIHFLVVRHLLCGMHYYSRQLFLAGY